MPEELKDLIEKIKEEGVKSAEDKAKAIEDEARKKAAAVMDEAKMEAERTIAGANVKAAKTQENTRASLEQAGRDLLLTLRKEINAMLDQLIASDVKAALKPAELAKIIAALVEEYSKRGMSDITVLLNREDLKNLEQGLFDKLKGAVKKAVTLRPSEDIRGGFIISYDRDRRQYDFTDEGLAEYIGAYLKPKLRGILGGSPGGKKA